MLARGKSVPPKDPPLSRPPAETCLTEIGPYAPRRRPDCEPARNPSAWSFIGSECLQWQGLGAP